MILPDDIPNLGSGRVVGVLGMPGAGKTIDLGQVVGRYDGPVLALDTVGALSEKVLAGADVWIVNVPKPLDLEALWKWTRQEWEKGERIVWNLKGWSPQEMQQLAQRIAPEGANMLTGLKKGLVVVDEIQRIAPDFSADLGRGSPAFKDWVTARRNQPVDLVWSSQRPAFVSMTVRGVTDFWLFHRLFWPNDMEVMAKVLRAIDGADALLGVMQAFNPGEAIAIDLPFMA